MERFRKRFILIVSALLVTQLGGTLGFILIEHYPVFDAFYMTLITISTVGYGEVHPLSYAGRIFNSFLIFFGVTVMLLAVGGMTQAIIELELNQYFGKRRTKKMIDHLKDHYIVCGFGRVGRGAASELQRAGAKFLVVDRGEEKLSEIYQLNARVTPLETRFSQSVAAASSWLQRLLIVVFSSLAMLLLLGVAAIGFRLLKHVTNSA